MSEVVVTITDEAVEAGARAWFASRAGRLVEWDQMSDKVHATYCLRARAVLEAAIPLLSATNASED